MNDVFADKEWMLVMLDSIGEAIVATDEQGRVGLCNKQAELLSGCSQSEAIGKPLGEVFRLVEEKSGAPQDHLLEQTINSSSPVLGEGLLLSKDGSTWLVSVNSSRIRHEDGRIAGVVIVFQNISERRRILDDRERSQRLDMMGFVAGGIAHDFNNILMAIVGNLSLARTIEKDMSADLLEVLAEAEKASLRARSLTYQLLTFAKEGVPVKQPVPLNLLIKESVSFILRGTPSVGDFDIPADLWIGDVDAGQISQVLQNLAINASQAMPPSGGTVAVKAANVNVEKESELLPLKPGRYVRISISDTGSGIAEENIGRIFEPYFTTKKNGSGLGLATSYSIIQKHGGHISVESKVGIGTTLAIFVPASEPSCAVDGEMPAPDQDWSGVRVLVMDDEEAIHLLLARMLKKTGCEMKSARDGAEAVAMYEKAMSEKERFDVVILDLTVPGQMGGDQALKKLRKIDPSVKALISSGRTTDPVIVNWREHGFAGVILKPYRMSELILTLGVAIRG